MATYWDVLTACERRIRGMASFEPVHITVRKAPVLVPLQDRFPQLVIAPRPDLAEQVVGRTSEGLWLGFEVYFGLLVPGRWDPELLRWRLERRDELRGLFLPPKSIAVGAPGIWNVEYDPAPSVPGGEAPDNADGSWQKFRFVDDRSKGAF